MLDNEKLPSGQGASRDVEGVARSAADMEELVQRLADRVVRDAEQLAARITKAAEAEAAGLIADARRKAEEIVYRAQKQAEGAADERKKAALALQEANQRAITIEADATREATQLKLKVKEDIDRHLDEVVGRIHNELRPSLDYLAQRAKTLEDEVRSSLGQQQQVQQASSAPGEPAKPAEAPKMTGERPSAQEQTQGARAPAGESAKHPQTRQEAKKPQAGFDGPTGAVEPAEGHQGPPPARCDQAGGTGKAAGAAAAPPPAAREDARQLVEGKVEIQIAPPISIARLLGVTRYLETTQDIKILQTSGSWSLGSVVTIQVDKPVPLLEILKSVPNVHDASLIDNAACGNDKERARRYMVTLIGTEAQQNKTPAEPGGRPQTNDR